MTRDQELWSMALHVERHHGTNGPQFIAGQIERNRLAGEQSGVDLWEAVAVKVKSLERGRCRPSS